MSEAKNHPPASSVTALRIPIIKKDRHILSFHDAQDARSLWAAIKARFRGNKESKKMQKNLLKQQFETFVVSCEDANLKFLRSLPSVWHVVATMIRGQPGLDELDFDDLYNNLKVYEHELKGASSSRRVFQKIDFKVSFRSCVAGMIILVLSKAYRLFVYGSDVRDFMMSMKKHDAIRDEYS
ncbi:hypothetical protein Tco_1258138 [Tanacetum coccineum]